MIRAARQERRREDGGHEERPAMFDGRWAQDFPKDEEGGDGEEPEE